jgi:CubicO group peptidase (beta-lactamase class C family)
MMRPKEETMDASAQWTGLDAARLERIGEHLQRRYVEPGALAGCQIAVVRHGHIAYARSFGLMDRERGRPVREDTIWRLSSLTKPLTAVALMMLYERGRFQLDEPVARYAPAWSEPRVFTPSESPKPKTEPARRLVTFRDLLSHTAGLSYSGLAPEDVRGPEFADSMEGFLEKLGGVPLAFQPGTAWRYSLAADACGALVEVISGRRFARFLEEEVFQPLGLRDTGFQLPEAKLERLAAGYRLDLGGELELAEDPAKSDFADPPGFVSGGGGLVATSSDYLRFCEMLRRGGELDGARILGPRTVELMSLNHLADGADLARAAFGAVVPEVKPGVGFGLGFAVNLGQVASGGYGAGDFGWSGAATSLFWVDPREDLSVVFMTGLAGPAPYDLRGELKSLIYSAIVD